jgi:peptidoglycan hydrolase CwlO-like protein
MKKINLIIAAGFLFFSALAFGQEVYKWVDEKGTVHFSDDLGQVPEKYRNRIQKETPPKELPPVQPISPAPPMEPPKPMEPGKEVAPTLGPGQKDALGRGEEWWRAKATEWDQKLKTAQRSYETTYNEWKAKEQELQASISKPDSFKRKLKAEIKDLEEKVKDWEKQIEEAKNMIENVLPKEARDYRANPEWLKIEK